MRLLEINKQLLNIAIVLLAIFLLSFVTFAQELSIERAIQVGLENSSQIKDVRDNIRQLTRSLAMDEAINDWKFDLTADYDYYLDREEDSKNLGITIGRTFLSGLQIEPTTKVSIDEDLDTSLYISLSKPIYPLLPTKLEEEYYRTDQELLKANKSLTEQKVDSILSWLEIYLNIARMTARQDIFIESRSKAEDNLAIVLERQQLGDAGKNDILTAKLSLENARYSLEESKRKLEDIYYNLAIELGIPVSEELVITDNNQYIAELREKAQQYSTEYQISTISNLMKLVEDNNSSLQANILNRAVLRKELEWSDKKDDPSINLTGTYNTESDNLTLGVGLSYQLYDGGQHKMSLEDKEVEIRDNISAYNDLYNKLNQELKQHIDNIELSQMALKKEELSLARSQYELEVAEKQLAIGLIDYLEYQDYWISAAEAKVNLKSLEDQLFIDRLGLIKFIDTGNIAEIIGGF